VKYVCIEYAGATNAQPEQLIVSAELLAAVSDVQDVSKNQHDRQYRHKFQTIATSRFVDADFADLHPVFVIGFCSHQSGRFAVGSN
jgi:hypothetical protein